MNSLCNALRRCNIQQRLFSSKAIHRRPIPNKSSIPSNTTSKKLVKRINSQRIIMPKKQRWGQLCRARTKRGRASPCRDHEETTKEV